jgi:hypothetical protein
MSFWEEVGVLFVALGILEPQTARHIDFDQPQHRAI